MQALHHIPQLSALWSRLRREKSEEEKNAEMLYALISEVRQDIADCRRNLMFADSDALTDMYIYAIKSHEMRYSHLLQMAKKAVG